MDMVTLLWLSAALDMIAILLLLELFRSRKSEDAVTWATRLRPSTCSEFYLPDVGNGGPHVPDLPLYRGMQYVWEAPPCFPADL